MGCKQRHREHGEKQIRGFEGYHSKEKSTILPPSMCSTQPIVAASRSHKRVSTPSSCLQFVFSSRLLSFMLRAHFPSGGRRVRRVWKDFRLRGGDCGNNVPPGSAGRTTFQRRTTFPADRSVRGRQSPRFDRFLNLTAMRIAWEREIQLSKGIACAVFESIACPSYFSVNRSIQLK